MIKKIFAGIKICRPTERKKTVMDFKLVYGEHAPYGVRPFCSTCGAGVFQWGDQCDQCDDGESNLQELKESSAETVQVQAQTVLTTY